MRFVVVAIVSVALLDVMPCGHPGPRTVSAGDACGGPSVCAPPSKCAALEREITMPSYRSSYVCTKECANDSDCGGLGIAMTCTGTGRLRGYDAPPDRVCIPVIAQDAGK